MGWTMERKDILRRMWLAGDTSGRIAEALGEVSRNAVMGMVNRMGLMGSADHNGRIRGRVSGACRPRIESPAATPANDDPISAPRGKAEAVALAPAPVSAPVRSPIRVATDGTRPSDWRTALTLVEDVMGHPYDPERPGHSSALVAIATILVRGDPRPLLSPVVPEAMVLASMRRLAEKGVIVGGLTPEAWLDPACGDVAFLIDMLVAEGVLDPALRKVPEAA